MENEDVLLQAIKEYKASHKEAPPELSFSMLDFALRHVNESSAVKVARNPLDKDHDWVPDTPCYNIGKVFVDDQGRLTLTIRRDNVTLTVSKLLDRIQALHKQIRNKEGDVMLQETEEKAVKLTDLYSHALIRDQWAGLPFDLVLAYYEREEEE